MVPSVSVMRTASRTIVMFSTCADLAVSIVGAESAFQTDAAPDGAGVWANTDAGARIVKKAATAALPSMVAPHRMARKYSVFRSEARSRLGTPGECWEALTCSRQRNKAES